MHSPLQMCCCLLACFAYWLLCNDTVRFADFLIRSSSLLSLICSCLLQLTRSPRSIPTYLSPSYLSQRSNSFRSTRTALVERSFTFVSVDVKPKAGGRGEVLILWAGDGCRMVNRSFSLWWKSFALLLQLTSGGK